MNMFSASNRASSGAMAGSSAGRPSKAAHNGAQKQLQAETLVSSSRSAGERCDSTSFSK
ncbi:hypothetical protein D9M72_652340 [compost metagenome]